MNCCPHCGGTSGYYYTYTASNHQMMGWVPFKIGGIRYREGKIVYLGHAFDVWDSYGLNQYKFRAGSFNEDARGRWYFNVAVEVDPQPSKGTKAIGIDLGLTDNATTSEGDRLHSREYRELESALAVAQRARKPKRAKAIHAKIRNRRKDALHKFSRKLVNESAAIFVGDVSSSQLIKTRMAKSVHDVSWSALKTMLDYKCDHAGVVFEVIDEANTTVTCSVCNSRTGPSGREGLRIREWTCSECGVTHDRDINAARNIRELGSQLLTAGSSPRADFKTKEE